MGRGGGQGRGGRGESGSPHYHTTTPHLISPHLTKDVLIYGGGAELQDPPTQNLGKPRVPELSHPRGGGGCWTANHPPTHPATKAVHNTQALDQFSEISEIFEAYGQPIHCCHMLSESHDEAEELEQCIVGCATPSAASTTPFLVA